MIENQFDENTIVETDKPGAIETKPKHIKTKRVYKKKVLEKFSYDDSKTTNFCINVYTLSILKQVCKDYVLPVSGTKPVLIHRITTHFKKMTGVVIIQKMIRGWIIRHMNKLRGPGVTDRTLCVNPTDACTLEPLNEVEVEGFYSYIDPSDTIYGFNISSLIHLLRTAKRIYNPYTREKFTKKQTSALIFLYNMTIFTNASFKENNEVYIRPDTRHPHRRPYSNRPRHTDLVNRITNLQNRPLHDGPVISSYNNYTPTVLPSSIITEAGNQQYQTMVDLRLRPINERITSMFLEIDQLGNYTNADWFNNLDHLKFARLYRAAFDIWNYHGQMSTAVKNEICPFHGPFDGIFNISIRHIDLSVIELKTICVIVFENLIYSSQNEEYRKLGALHALTALTIVSQPARQAMPWLYESVLF